MKYLCTTEPNCSGWRGVRVDLVVGCGVLLAAIMITK